MALRAVVAASAWRTVTRPVAWMGGALVAGAFLVGGWRAATVVDGAAVAAYRLRLDTTSNPVCYYDSAWNDGDVYLSHDAGDGRTVTLTSRYDFRDGCTWEATETLTPRGRDYAYAYSERLISCRPGKRHGRACARHGTVSVTPER
jgi:hypothetical protein